MNRRDFLKCTVVVAILPSVVFAKSEPRLHVFDNLIDVDGKPITALIHPDQEASFAAAGKAGQDSGIELIKAWRDYYNRDIAI